MFKAFSTAVHARYNDLARGELFVVDIEDLFTSYLLAFPEGTNPIFRKQTEHDCSCCKNFIRNLGSLVALNPDGTRASVWDHMDALPYPYDVVARRLSDIVRQAPIVSVYRTKERQYGTESNRDTEEPTRVWNHFYGKVASRHFSPTPDKIRGEHDAIAQVLRRGLEQINDADLDTVSDLIHAQALYRGSEHLAAVVGFKGLRDNYLAAPDREAFIWMNLDNRNARFRNTVIGTLLVDLAEGVELEKAVKKFEAKVAPENYKRPTALVTPKMIESALETLDNLGLRPAVERRYAAIEDVSVNDVLFVDNAVRGSMKDALADALLGSVKPRPVDLKHATPISIDDFLKLEKTSIDLLVKNSHVGNFVSLTAPQHAAAPLFKWANNFGWSYAGDVTDSIKERVKAAGGNVTNAKLRVSLAWSNADDLDIHAFTPGGQRIYFGNRQGVLDVDMNAGGRMNRVDPVENLSWMQLQDGVYRIEVNNFTRRDTENVGFTIEVESEGQLMQFAHSKGLASKQTVEALSILIENGKIANIKVGSGLVGGTFSQKLWGVDTETLVPVDTLMASPNFWEGSGDVGNKHWFFMLKGCKNPGATRGIYNEFLRSDLDQHRKVFELIGAKTKCPPSDAQLSGVGFSSTKSDTVTVVVDGRRAYTIQF